MYAMYLLSINKYDKALGTLVDQTTDSECRLCMEDDETSIHIMAECPALAFARLKTFGNTFQSSPLSWSLTQVVGFLREANIDFLQGSDLGVE